MICENCQKHGEKSKEVFTALERTFILSSVAGMMKWLENNGQATHDEKVIGNSVTTKILLSFPEPGRSALLNTMRRSAEVDIVMGSCPHGKLEVVS